MRKALGILLVVAALSVWAPAWGQVAAPATVRTVATQPTPGAACTASSGVIYIALDTKANCRCTGTPTKTWGCDLASAPGAGGSPTQVQYNSGGALAGDADFTYNATTKNLTATTFTGALVGNADTATNFTTVGRPGLGSGIGFSFPTSPYNAMAYSFGLGYRNQLLYVDRRTGVTVTGDTGTVSVAYPYQAFWGNTASGVFTTTSSASTVVIEVSKLSTTGLPTSVKSNNTGWFTTVESWFPSQYYGTITVEAKYDDTGAGTSYDSPTGNGTTWHTVGTITGNTSPVARTMLTFTGAVGANKIYAMRWTITDFAYVGAQYLAGITLQHQGEEPWNQYLRRYDYGSTTRMPMLSPISFEFQSAAAPFILDANSQNQLVTGLRAAKADALSNNGANCSAGQAPLGVDASGAVEGCWTVPVASAKQVCTRVENLTMGDDDFEFWIAPYAITVTSVGCRCIGTCSTMATFRLESRAGVAMTGTPTCATVGSTTYTAITANGGLTAGEGLAFDVTNTDMSPETDTYMLCATYTVN